MPLKSHPMVSVIIPTYNPSIERLNRTIAGLTNQTLPSSEWELIIIDNNSSQSFKNEISIPHDLSSKIVTEPRQGLTFARLKGFAEAKGKYIVMVDDDNILEKDYLKQVVAIFEQDSSLGAMGGNIEPDFEITPPEWTKPFWGKLAIRNLGDKELISNFHAIGQPINHYPAFAPVGAGMAIRRKALGFYMSEIEKQIDTISDRKGNSLSSSGDNDIVMHILKSGYEVGFSPDLKLVHLIPASRITKTYLARLNYGIMKSWTQFLLKHGLCPWQQIPGWSVSLRKVKAYITSIAWKNNENYINWKGRCGTFDALTQ